MDLQRNIVGGQQNPQDGFCVVLQTLASKRAVSWGDRSYLAQAEEQTNDR